MRTFYKYRPLGTPKFNNRFREIIKKQQLYCSKYSENNDPLELYFYSQQELGKELIDNIRGGKEQRYLCSFSSEEAGIRDNVMWAMYANNHKGCCIEFVIRDQNVEPKQVVYEGKLLECNHPNESFIEDTLFYHKTKPWEHEKEWRVCMHGANNHRPTLDISIIRIFFGAKMKKRSYSFWKRYIQEQLGNEIQVSQIEPEDLDYGNGKNE